MKTLFIVLALALPLAAVAQPHPFEPRDLVMMNRISDVRVSPDGKAAVFQMRETDYDENRGRTGIWRLDLTKRNAQPQRLTDRELNATAPRWAPDGKSVYFLAKSDQWVQVWQQALEEGRSAKPVTQLDLDVNSYKISPDGRQILLSIDVFTDCADLACTRERLDSESNDQVSGRLYHSLFVRHWDTWSDGRRSQLFIADLDEAAAIGSPKLLTRDIDGDVPSKPFGDATEFAFSADGQTVYFDARVAGESEAWSTNFDVYSVPADGSEPPRNLTLANLAWDAYPLPSHDGKTLYYLAMKTPGFEADRFAITALDLASGNQREVAPGWDRSAGPLQLSADGKTLYTATDDEGDHALFAVDVRSGNVTRLVGDGNVTAFDMSQPQKVIARQDFKQPTDLYRLKRGQLERLTEVNAERQRDIAYGDFERFTFKGWNGDEVQGFVFKPAGFEPGMKYPVAFLIHGGPQGAWTNGFHYRWNPQSYAGKGFAVVAINFHGSTGYGQAFTNAISRHWGDRPLEDLQKGWAAALQRYPFLDASRACALGASYGGYMINWIAGVWNEPWRCLVNHDGIFDNRMMAYSTEELWFSEFENGGTPWQQPEAYEQFNPVNHVGDWRVPMLVVHGALDFRLPLEQGIATFTALQRRGIASEFLVYPDENHWVLQPHNSMQWHGAVIDWLKRWTQ